MNKKKILLPLILIIQLNLYAQYEITLSNEVVKPEGLFFDVYIKSTGDDFTLGSYQCIFDFNNTLEGVESMEFKYIDSTSQLSNQPVVKVGILTDESIKKLCIAAGAGYDRISSMYLRIGTFALLGEVSAPDSVNLKWSFEGNLKTIIADGDFNDMTYKSAHSDQQNPLPVELISFNAVIEDEKTVIRWATATELNSYGFEVQRKKLGEEKYKTLGLIKSTGGNKNSTYIFKDNEVLSPGIYTYRLKQIDTDGTFEYLGTVDMNVSSPTKYLMYQNYPNPFNPSTTISYSLKEKSKVELKIFDITGKLITNIFDNVQESGIHKYEWTADDFASGILICQLKTISVESEEVYSSIIKMILLK